jgi:hypothetical protein
LFSGLNMFTMPRFALTLLLSSMVAVQGRLFTPARELAGVEVFENDEFLVEVSGNGNVPKYTFSSKDDPEHKYKVMFQKVFESKLDQKIGSTISLPSLNWTFGLDTEDESAFWINGTEKDTGSAKFSKLAFRNVLKDNSLKFDVIIEGYQFGADADALNLIYKLSNSTVAGGSVKSVQEESLEDGDAPSESTDTKICFNGANGKSDQEVCFSIVDTATATDGEEEPVDVAVSVSLDNAEGGIKLQYARFEGDLMHDPTFGFLSVDVSFNFFDSFLNFFRNFWNALFWWRS